MDAFGLNYDSQWATNFRNVANRASALSLQHNQWRADDSQCAIRVEAPYRTECFDLVCPTPERVRLEFHIGGGTDCPFFSLVLRLRGSNSGLHHRRELVMRVRYYGWAPNSGRTNHKGDVEGRFRQPIGLSAPIPTVATSFSRRLYDVKFEAKHPKPQDMEGFQKLKWLDTVQYFQWSATEPVCVGFGQDISGYPDDCRNAAEMFRKLQGAEYTVHAYLRGQEGIIQGWRLFCAQPSPCLPTWWRYAKNPQNGPTVRELESLDDLRRHHGRREKGQHVNGDTIISMTPTIAFGEEREFETFIKGGLIREHQFQQDRTTRAYNRTWTCQLIQVVSINRGGNPDAYFMAVNMETFILENGGVLDPPYTGTPVSVKIKLNSDRQPEAWEGKVVESRTHRTVIYALRPAGGPGFVMNESYEAHFSFGFLGGPLNSMLRSASWLMYGEINRGISSNSWLKTLVMGTLPLNSQVTPARGLMSRSKPTTIIVSEEVVNQNLNDNQARAVATSLSDKGGMTLISGPPGTGKTNVIVTIALCAARMGVKMLVCAGSNTAVDVIADRIQIALESAMLPLSGVYRAKRKAYEQFPGDSSNMPEDVGNTAVLPFQELDDVSNMNATICRDLEITLRKMETDMQPRLSLTKRILDAVKSYQVGGLDATKGAYSRDELSVISSLDSAINAPLVPSFPGQDDEDIRKKHNWSVEKCWIAAQRFYLQHANIVLSTCANTFSRIFADYRPQLCIVDEAGQVSEPECLVPLVSFLGSLKNISLLGDVKQLRPTMVSTGQNEFGEQFQMSLFERLIRTGLKPIQLTTQYRMHPSICSFPNSEFYEGVLENDSGVNSRPTGLMFEQWAKTYHGCEPRNRSIFVSVQDGELLQELKGTSKVNLTNAEVVHDIVKSMVEKGNIKPKAIMIICYYRAQMKLISERLRGTNLSAIRISTVDSSQGGEAPVVIVDIVTPGGKFPLGFVRDHNRLNVALTRARDGLVIVGNADMGRGQYNSRGIELFNRFVKFHRNRTWNLKGETVTSSALLAMGSSRFGPVQQKKHRLVPPAPPAKRLKRPSEADDTNDTGPLTASRYPLVMPPTSGLEEGGEQASAVLPSPERMMEVYDEDDVIWD